VKLCSVKWRKTREKEICTALKMAKAIHQNGPTETNGQIRVVRPL
jgi:hypothetical protein